jgi:DNA-binding LacI/PurR family transcriptional regulator
MVTISDVAKHAGVSTSTVSYALSGKRSLSRDTRHRIEASIGALGYRPNAGARALASRRTNVIAVMVPLRADNNVPVIMHYVAALADAARARGYDILLLTQEEGSEGILRVAESALADAIILMDIRADEPRVRTLNDVELPSVLIGTPDDAAGVATVDFDFAGAASLAVDHLAGLGHTDVVLLGGSPGAYDRDAAFARATRSGFEDAAARDNVNGSWRPFAADSYEVVLQQLRQLFQEQPATTALVVNNEAALPPLLAALRALDRPVPETVSVVAICPDDLAVSQAVPLTNIVIPVDDIGRRAIETVLSGEGASTYLAPPQLIVRGSTLRRSDNSTERRP